MWMLDNQTPYQAERTWVRDKDGVHQWIVVVKATYNIAIDGTLTLSDSPLDPLHAPEYVGQPGNSSLLYEADLVGMKPGTDVYLNAIAYAPKGKPCEKVEVALRLGRIHKELVVYGERTWRRSLSLNLTPSSAKAFETMSITYERAHGGFDQKHSDPRKHCIDFWNPVGTGVTHEKQTLLGKPAPQIEFASSAGGRKWPAGFGAIASYWFPRKEYAGTYDEKWEARRKPLLPFDYDSKWLLCAPPDQQVMGFLKGGEKVELTNLTPSGKLQFSLPKVSFQFQTYFGGERRHHQGKLVSVIIESKGPRLIMVWQTSLEVKHDGEYLDKTLIQQMVEIQ